MLQVLAKSDLGHFSLVLYSSLYVNKAVTNSSLANTNCGVPEQEKKKRLLIWTKGKLGVYLFKINLLQELSRNHSPEMDLVSSWVGTYQLIESIRVLVSL